MAHDLYARNCLWNSFILVGNVLNLMLLMATALPEMYRAFAEIESSLDGGTEEQVFEAIFRDLPSLDFSRSVLAEFPGEFCVMPVTGVTWSDLGDPRRLLAAISSGSGRMLGENRNVRRSQSFAFPSLQQKILEYKTSQGQQ